MPGLQDTAASQLRKATTLDNALSPVARLWFPAFHLRRRKQQSVNGSRQMSSRPVRCAGCGKRDEACCPTDTGLALGSACVAGLACAGPICTDPGAHLLTSPAPAAWLRLHGCLVQLANRRVQAASSATVYVSVVLSGCEDMWTLHGSGMCVRDVASTGARRTQKRW